MVIQNNSCLTQNITPAWQEHRRLSKALKQWQLWCLDFFPPHLNEKKDLNNRFSLIHDCQLIYLPHPCQNKRAQTLCVIDCVCVCVCTVHVSYCMLLNVGIPLRMAPLLLSQLLCSQPSIYETFISVCITVNYCSLSTHLSLYINVYLHLHASWSPVAINLGRFPKARYGESRKEYSQLVKSVSTANIIFMNECMAVIHHQATRCWHVGTKCFWVPL